MQKTSTKNNPKKQIQKTTQKTNTENKYKNNLNNKIMNTAITTTIEKNTLNNSYYLSMSINNGYAWFFSSYKKACKAQKRLEELIKDREKSEHMTYREVTKYILNIK